MDNLINYNKINSIIKSTGRYLPNLEIKNNDIKNISPFFAQIIEEKTGIKARRYASENEANSELAINAAQDCLDKITISPEEIDAIILATSTPDELQPATAARVQARLGAKNAFAFDINSVCSGGIYALALGNSLIKSHFCQVVLVIASEVYSRFLNQEDLSTMPYFGDGAGAILLQRGGLKDDTGILHCILRTDGGGADLVSIPAGGSKKPGWKVENKNDFYFTMQGREIFEFAVNKGSEIIHDCMGQYGCSINDIKCVITHQANENIIKEISNRTKIPLEKYFMNLQYYGNTAAASVMIGLDETVSTGRIIKGDLILLVAFGGGLSWGAALIRM